MTPSEEAQYCQYLYHTRRAPRKILLRTLSRIIDGLFVAVLLLSFQVSLDFFLPFFFSYNLICSFFHGKTLGRFAFGIEILGKQKLHFFHYLFREIFFFLLFPILLFQTFTGFRLIHDFFLKTYIDFERDI